MRIKRRLHKSDLADINYKINSLKDCLTDVQKIIEEPDINMRDLGMAMSAVVAWPYRIKESLEKSISSIGKEM